MEINYIFRCLEMWIRELLLVFFEEKEGVGEGEDLEDGKWIKI